MPNTIEATTEEMRRASAVLAEVKADAFVQGHFDLTADPSASINFESTMTDLILLIGKSKNGEMFAGPRIRERLKALDKMPRAQGAGQDDIQKTLSDRVHAIYDQLFPRATLQYEPLTKMDSPGVG